MFVNSSESQRILIGADTFAPDVNGAARFAERLSTALVRAGHEVHVLCPSPTGHAGEEDFHGVRVHRVRSRPVLLRPDFRVSTPWAARAEAERVVAAVRPDVVHVQAHFLVGRALARAAKTRGIRLVATNHFMPENLLGYVRLPATVDRALARWAWRDLGRVFGAADVVTAPTPLAAKLLRDNGFGRPVQAVSCGIDVQRYRDHGPAVAGTVLFVGRLDAEKHVHELLEAVARLKTWRPLMVEIVGDGACRAQLAQQARELGIAHRVRFHGHVSETELLAAYGRAEVFCMPGIAELQSLATLEAMAASTAVVAADAVALPHLVRQGHNGWLYPPGDVEALAIRLRAVLESPETAQRMGAASAQLAAEHDQARTIETFERLYRAEAPTLVAA